MNKENKLLQNLDNLDKLQGTETVESSSAPYVTVQIL